MQYDFLNSFPKRMKSIGLHALLYSNSSQKAIWKEFGFETMDEQLNMVFSVLLYVMEQSLKEDNCTIDDISTFIDDINTHYYKKSMSFGDCKRLGDFIINVVLSNQGKSMHFDGFNYETGEYQAMHISYVSNRIVYLHDEIRRTSYYLTDDGYSLLLGTLEVENNMKLTIQEMIFHMHLDKQSYDKALDDIKNVFNLMRIQLQKIQEAMGRIRRNALDYNVADYGRLLQEDLNTITQTRDKFRMYQDTVKSRVEELEKAKINIEDLSKEDEEKISYLKEIEVYLNRAIDEHQRILNNHFDLQSLYSEELEKISSMSMIQRFSFRSEIFEKVLNDARVLDRMDIFFRPLFNQDPDKVFNLNKILDAQRNETAGDPGSGTNEIDDFDEEAWKEEQEKKRREKLKRYEDSLSVVLEKAAESGIVDLATINETVCDDEEAKKKLIPNINIFKEIMVELVRAKSIDIVKLRKEKSSFIQEESNDFQLNKMLLSMMDNDPAWKNVIRIEIQKQETKEPVVFGHVQDEYGNNRNIRCSNVTIRLIRE